MNLSKLEKINASAYQYYCSQVTQFKKICAPLELISIPHFGYLRIFNNGNYLHVSTHDNFVKNMYISIPNIGKYFSKQVDITYKNPCREFFVDNDITLFKKKEDPIVKLVFDLNIWHFYHFWNINNRILNIYYFAMRREDIYAHDFFIENRLLLRKFIKYFNYKTEFHLISSSDQTKLGHFDNSFEFHGKSDDQLIESKIQLFLQAIRTDKKLIQGRYGKVKLTKREIQCLDYLAIGYGMKGLANILDISPRTVESHINNAKLKTGYDKQLLLTQFIKEFKEYNPLT